MFNFEIPEISDTPEFPMIDHYVLDDGRIWSVPEAKFVPTAPEGAVIGTCPDESGKNSLEGLIGCLKFYKYNLGELA